MVVVVVVMVVVMVVMVVVVVLVDLHLPGHGGTLTLPYVTFALLQKSVKIHSKSPKCTFALSTQNCNKPDLVSFLDGLM